MILCLIYMVFTGFLIPLNAQENIPELEKKLETLSQEERLPALTRLANAYMIQDPQKCLSYGEQALTEARQSNSPQYIAEALYYIACGLRYLNRYQEAIEYLKQAVALFKNQETPEMLAKSHTIIGICFWHLGRNQESLDYLKKALDVSLPLGDKKRIANIYNSIGLAYWSASEFSRAIDAQRLSLQYRTEIDDQIGMAFSLNNIGAVYDSLGEIDSALEYHFKALEIREKIKNEAGIASSLNNIGILYQKQGDYAKALSYLEKALAIKEKGIIDYTLGNTLNNMGSTYLAMKEYKKAISYLDRAIAVYDKFNDISGKTESIKTKGISLAGLKHYDQALAHLKMALSMSKQINEPLQEAEIRLAMADIDLDKGDTKAALPLITSGLELAKKIGALHPQRNAYLAFSNYYKLKNDYKNAYLTYVQYEQCKEKILSEKHQKIIESMKIRYEADKMKEKNLVLEKDNRLQTLELERKNFILYSVIILLALGVTAGFFFIKRYLHLLVFWKRHRYIWKYRLIEKIGSGGFSVVYKAKNIMNKQSRLQGGEIALKVLREELFENRDSRLRFEREANICHQLKHPNIVQIYESGIHANVPFIAMEFLDGITLEKRLQKGFMSLEEVILITVQVAEAIDFLHRSGIMHRDLKPCNIMLLTSPTNTYHVKLMDFGLAKTA